MLPSKFHGIRPLRIDISYSILPLTAFLAVASRQPLPSAVFGSSVPDAGFDFGHKVVRKRILPANRRRLADSFQWR